MKAFKKNPFPTEFELITVGDITGLDDDQLNQWFEAKRAKLGIRKRVGNNFRNLVTKLSPTSSRTGCFGAKTDPNGQVNKRRTKEMAFKHPELATAFEENPLPTKETKLELAEQTGLK